MAESRHPTPEKQLLNLIERPTSQDIERKQKERQNRGLFSLDLLKSRVISFAGQFKKNFDNGRESVDLKQINKVLRAGIILLLAYLALNFAFNYRRIKVKDSQLKNNEAKKSRALFLPGEEPFEESFPKKDLAYYLDPIKKRNIFKFGVVEQKQDKDNLGSGRIAKLAEGLKLVGISFSDFPEAMIESEKESKTYFAKEGDFVRQLSVKKIFKDYVVLEYEGEEYNLK